jgi:uncharacterized protein (TIGR03435 family)
VTPDQIIGAPSWVGAERFNILANADSPVSIEQGRLMLRNMLTDRFKLVSHTDARGTLVIDDIVNPGGGFWSN